RDCVLFFFFQAEDGIRDWSVTGVQTCALPICQMADVALDRSDRTVAGALGVSAKRGRQRGNLDRIAERGGGSVRLNVGDAIGRRSEERRVGKEWRCRWGPCHYKKERGGECRRK